MFRRLTFSRSPSDAQNTGSSAGWRSFARPWTISSYLGTIITSSWRSHHLVDITQAILLLYEHPANNRAKPSSITGSMLKTPLTGVDASTSFTVAFGSGSHLSAHAVLTCNITLPPQEPGVYVRFRGGNIKIATPIYAPRKFTVEYFDKPGSGKVVKEVPKVCDYVGSGWHFQADEARSISTIYVIYVNVGAQVARCVRAGKLESDVWSHDKSIVEMEIFDEV